VAHRQPAEHHDAIRSTGEFAPASSSPWGAGPGRAFFCGSPPSRRPQSVNAGRRDPEATRLGCRRPRWDAPHSGRALRSRRSGAWPDLARRRGSGGRAGARRRGGGGRAGARRRGGGGRAGARRRGGAVAELGLGGVEAVAELGRGGVVAVAELGLGGVVAVAELGLGGVVAVAELGLGGVVAVAELALVRTPHPGRPSRPSCATAVMATTSTSTTRPTTRRSGTRRLRSAGTTMRSTTPTPTTAVSRSTSSAGTGRPIRVPDDPRPHQRRDGSSAARVVSSTNRTSRSPRAPASVAMPDSKGQLDEALRVPEVAIVDECLRPRELAGKETSSPKARP
jgi:hypothetical protein